MIVNGKTLLALAPIKNMETEKLRINGMSYGLSELGYDIRIKQEVILDPSNRFTLASSVEEFNVPECLGGVVHDKSSWARQGLSVFNTVLEPNWKGFLTLELAYFGSDSLIVPAGSPIAQIIFHDLHNTARYEGKYQNQGDHPVEAIHE